MSTQDPSKYQSNQDATPNDKIAPGDPMWSTGGEHENISFGWGYGAHDPVSLLKGNYDKGAANIRFGKFTFDETKTAINGTHGDIIEFPIYRVEGSTGTFTLILKQSDKSGGIGQIGTLADVIQHQYGVCKSDLDMWSLNKPYDNEVEKQHREKMGFPVVDGLEWDAINRELRMTWVPGESEKRLYFILPYRHEVVEMKPAVLRETQTYYIQEYNAVQANKYNGLNYIEQKGHNYGHSYVTRPNDATSRITNHKHYYRCYTLPFPRSWFENINGNTVYINNWDKNYQYRVNNNTERERFEPNRPDDLTEQDLPTDGYVTRYDHYNKMNIVKGKTRFSRWSLRRSSTPRWADRSTSKVAGKTVIPDGTDQTWNVYGTYTSSGDLEWPQKNTSHNKCDSPEQLNAGRPGWRCCRFGWFRCFSFGWTPRSNHRVEITYPDQNTGWFIDVPSNAEPTEHHYVKDTLTPQTCPQRWTGMGYYNGREQTNPNRDPGNWYSANWARNWIANDARITHRRYPEFPNAFMVGILGLKQDIVAGRIDNDSATGSGGSLDHWDVHRRRLWPRTSAEIPSSFEPKWIPLPRSTANNVVWQRNLSPADPTIDKINIFNHNNPSANYDEFYSAGSWKSEYVHPETPWNALVGSNNHNWGVINYSDQSWYESTRMDMDAGDPQRDGNAIFSDPLQKATATGTLNAGDWIYTGTPKDQTYNYGGGTNGLGDMVAGMFNHAGCDDSEFAPFGTPLGSVYVMGEEDPSGLKEEYDYPNHGNTLPVDLNNVALKGGEANAVWDEKKYYSNFCGWKPTNSHSITLNFNWSNQQFPNLGGYHGVDEDLGDWTDRWISTTNNSIVSAGLLEPADKPLTWKNPDGTDNDYFPGYKWDDTVSFDTSLGTGVNKTGGFGSAGHGEGGKSRYLWDHHHMVHPLSSYELNQNNLKGYYTTCIDHVPRTVSIEMVKDNEDDEYDFGFTAADFIIIKSAVVEPTKWARYDYRVLVDHFISPGATYQTDDGWTTGPTGGSLNSRLFSFGPAGVGQCDPADPVCFLGLSAGNQPGGTMDSALREAPPVPGKLKLTPVGNDTIKVYKSGQVTDYLKSDSNYITVPTNTNPCSPEIGVGSGVCNPNTAEEKSYEFKFKNVGERPIEIAFSNVYRSNYGAYVETKNGPADCPDGCHIDDEATGDKLDDWSPAGGAIVGHIDENEQQLADVSPGVNHVTGAAGFTNTVLLSSGHAAMVKYDVKCQTGNTRGYFFTHEYTVDLLNGTTKSGNIAFNIGATL